MNEQLEEVLKLIGKAIRCDYPRHNIVGMRPEYEPRRLRVSGVRDFAEQPLSIVAPTLRPLVNRTGPLVTALDLDKGLQRKFYAGVMRNVTIIDALPVGPFDVVLLEADSDPEIVYRAECAEEAVAFLRRWMREPLTLTIGITPGRLSA